MLLYVLRTHSFSLLSNIPICRYMVVIIQPQVDGYLSHFQFQTVINDTVMKIHLQVFVWIHAFYFYFIYFLLIN